MPGGEGDAPVGEGDAPVGDGEAGTASDGEGGTTGDATTGRDGDATADETATTSRDSDGAVGDDGPPEAGTATTGRAGDDGATGVHSDDADSGVGGRKFAGPAHQTTIGGDGDDTSTEAAREFDALPHMRVLGQVHDTYVVAETPDGLVLVDQHAADERVQYERLREQFAGDTTAQVLADPVEVPLTAIEAADLETHREALARLGFRTELDDDGRRAVVTTVPTVLGDALDPDHLPDVLARVVAADRSGAETVAALADDLLADLACYPAVTGNTPLSEGDVTALLAALDDCENPYACPHGRPVVIQLSADELDERFERDYPGHP